MKKLTIILLILLMGWGFLFSFSLIKPFPGIENRLYYDVKNNNFYYITSPFDTEVVYNKYKGTLKINLSFYDSFTKKNIDKNYELKLTEKERKIIENDKFVLKMMGFINRESKKINYILFLVKSEDKKVNIKVKGRLKYFFKNLFKLENS